MKKTNNAITTPDNEIQLYEEDGSLSFIFFSYYNELIESNKLV